MNKRKLGLIFIISIALSLISAGIGYYYVKFPALERGLDDNNDLFISGEYGYHTFRIPALLSLPNGIVLALCEGRSSSSADYGDIDIVYRRFTPNSGWGSQQVLIDGGPKIAGNPVPVFDNETQTLFLLYCINNDDVFIINSTDYGITWGTSINVTDSVKLDGWDWYATGPGHGIQLTSGRLLVPCDHGSKKEDGLHADELYSHIIYSDDHGESWELGHIFDQGDECMAVETVDNRVYLNMRQPDKDRGFPEHQRLYAYSSDGGETFGAVSNDETLIEPRCQASLCRFSIENENDRNRILFLNPASRTRDHLKMRISYDEGTSWSSGKLIFRGHSAYSDVQVGRNKEIMFLFERGFDSPYEKITFVNTTIDWLE